jgi:hypothetical protein
MCLSPPLPSQPISEPHKPPIPQLTPLLQLLHPHFNPLHHCFPIRRPRRRHRLPRIRPQPRHIPRALHTRCIPQLHDALVVERRAEDNSDGYPIIVARPELRRARAAVYPLATQQRGNALLARLDGLDELDRWGKSDSKLDSWVSGESVQGDALSISGFKLSTTTAPMASVLPHRMIGWGVVIAGVLRCEELRSVCGSVGRSALSMST